MAFAFGSALLAAANIAVGVLVFQGVSLNIRSIRHSSAIVESEPLLLSG